MVSLITGLVAAFIGLTAVLYTQKQIRTREIEEAHRGKKVELYNGFLKTVQKVIAGENENVPVKPIKQKEMIMFMMNFKTEIILWSSPDVINAYRKYESGSTQNIEILLPLVDDLYREMRKDIGLSNKGLPTNQLVKMYLSDPNELDEAIAHAAS